MTSTFRRTASALALTVLLLPAAALHAAQRPSRPAAPAAESSITTRISSFWSAIIRVVVDAGIMIDGNG
jgi:hypothetical protein